MYFSAPSIKELVSPKADLFLVGVQTRRQAGGKGSFSQCLDTLAKATTGPKRVLGDSLLGKHTKVSDSRAEVVGKWGTLG